MGGGDARLEVAAVVRLGGGALAAFTGGGDASCLNNVREADALLVMHSSNSSAAVIVCKNTCESTLVS